MRKKLVVCGDSFYSPVSSPDSCRGTHFCEVLASNLGWDLVSFAKGACSNQVIRLQIDEAMKESPDLIIIGVTGNDRMEIPVTHRKEKGYWNLVHSNESAFRPQNGLKDILYSTRSDTSQNNLLFQDADPRLVSETLNNLFWYRDDYVDILPEGIIDILEQWFCSVYDMNWKKLQDTWILSSGFSKLEQNNMPYFVASCGTGLLLNEDIKMYEKKFIYDAELDPRSYCTPDIVTPAPYHITVKDSLILAEKWTNFLEHQTLYQL